MNRRPRAVRLRVTPERLAALVEGRGHAPGDTLAAALGAMRDPVALLRLHVDEGAAHGWLDRRASAILSRAAEGDPDELELLALPADEAPAGLASLGGTSPAQPSSDSRLSFAPADLAVVLSGRDAELAAARVRGDEPERTAARSLIRGLRTHWQLEAWPAARSSGDEKLALEGLDSAGGPWLVRPRGGEVTLEPVTRPEVEARIRAMLAAVLGR